MMQNGDGLPDTRDLRIDKRYMYGIFGDLQTNRALETGCQYSTAGKSESQAQILEQPELNN